VPNNYPDDWNWRRKKAYERDDYSCTRCGAKGGSDGNTELHAHHELPISQGGSHKLSNLTTVCKSCHEEIHGHNIPTGSDFSKNKNTITKTSRTQSTGATGGQSTVDSSIKEWGLPERVIVFTWLLSGIIGGPMVVSGQVTDAIVFVIFISVVCTLVLKLLGRKSSDVDS
jgi:hypothetical protein